MVRFVSTAGYKPYLELPGQKLIIKDIHPDN